VADLLLEGETIDDQDLRLPRRFAREREHRHVRRIETGHLPVEGELCLESPLDRLGAPEAMLLALEGDVRVRDAPSRQRVTHHLRLLGWHDPVLGPLQEQDRTVQLLEM
jgi:hypothetical protein